MHHGALLGPVAKWRLGTGRGYGTGALARSKSCSPVKEFADDVQMTSVTRGLFNHMHDDPAQVGEFVPQGIGVTTPRGCRQRRAGNHGIGTATLVVVEGENHLRRSRCRQRGMAIRPCHRLGRSGDDLLEPVPLSVPEMFYEPEGVQPEGRTDVVSACVSSPSTMASTLARCAARNADRIFFSLPSEFMHAWCQ